MERKRGAQGQGREMKMRKREATEAQVVGKWKGDSMDWKRIGEFSKGKRESYPLQNDGSPAYDHFQSMQYTTISQPTAGDDNYSVMYMGTRTLTVTKMAVPD